MRGGEFTRSAAVLAKILDELAILVELGDAGWSFWVMSHRNKNIAIGRNLYVGRLTQRIRPIAGDARLAERHQKPSIGAELVDHMSLAVFLGLVGCPDIALPVDVKAVWPVEHALAKAGDKLAALIELHDRIEVRSNAVVGGAAIERPEALAVRIDFDADGRAPFAAFRQLRPIFFQAIRIARAVGILCARRCCRQG